MSYGREFWTGVKRKSRDWPRLLPLFYAVLPRPDQTPLIKAVSLPPKPQPASLPTPSSFPFAAGQLPGPELGQAVMDHRLSYGVMEATTEAVETGPQST